MTEPVFYLGVHRPHWLALAGVPLFVSLRTLAGRRTLPRAIAPWIQDCGGFTELSLYGEWRTDLRTFVALTRRHAAEIGQMREAAIQDWMCEPSMVAKTGLSVGEHIRRTVHSYLDLRDAAPELPWLPVLQGWSLSDYLSCLDLYTKLDVHRTRYGIGSVCRRQSTGEIGRIVARLASEGLGLHGFGVKTGGLRLYGQLLESADSMAWSSRARRSAPLPGHTHRNCANCLEWALLWRSRLVGRLEGGQSAVQLALEDVA